MVAHGFTISDIVLLCARRARDGDRRARDRGLAEDRSRDGENHRFRTAGACKYECSLMPLHSTPEAELREHCKRAIEGLEAWLRRLINDRFSTEFGPDYISAKKPNGDNLIRTSLVKQLVERRNKEPKRFARLIDAAFLDDQIDLICNPDHY